MLKIHDDSELPNEGSLRGAVLRTDDETDLPHEGASFRDIMNRNRQMRRRV